MTNIRFVQDNELPHLWWIETKCLWFWFRHKLQYVLSTSDKREKLLALYKTKYIDRKIV